MTHHAANLTYLLTFSLNELLDNLSAYLPTYLSMSVYIYDCMHLCYAWFDLIGLDLTCLVPLLRLPASGGSGGDCVYAVQHASL